MKLPDAPQASSPFWWLWERFTDVHEAAYRASNGRIGGTYGGEERRQRTHPLLATKDGDNIVIVASKGGVHKHPAWYHNLMAHPETTVNWYGEVRRMRARETEGEERERLWKLMTGVYPTYEDYQRRTSRRIPVVLLEPI